MQGNNYVASVSVGRFVSVKYEASQTAIIEKEKALVFTLFEQSGSLVSTVNTF